MTSLDQAFSCGTSGLFANNRWDKAMIESFHRTGSISAMFDQSMTYMKRFTCCCTLLVEGLDFKYVRNRIVIFEI
ncbi:hypothetical protein AKJ16_DCAP25786 [Drosera capensis]